MTSAPRPIARVLRMLLVVVSLSGGCAVDNPVGDDVVSGHWSLREIAGAAPAVAVAVTIDNGVAASVEATGDCRQILGSLTVVESRPAGGDATFTMPGWSPGACPAAEDDTMAAVRDALEATRSWSVADGPTVLRLTGGPGDPVLVLERRDGRTR